MLLFLPDEGRFHWAVFDTCVLAEGDGVFAPGWADRLLADLQGRSVDTVAYLLRHGGERFTEPVTLVDDAVMADLELVAHHLPERNAMTLRLVREWRRRLPEATHLIECDTAFFTALPAVASTYAVPAALRERGLRRYGTHGLAHQFVWQQVEERLPGVRRLVSVNAGEQPDVAAICEGRPVETSSGFTPVEGVMSSTRCGEIDPTVVFQLHAAGMTLEEINEVLTSKSGLVALTGGRTFWDLASGDPGFSGLAALEMLVYQLVRAIGASIAALGGIDAMAFTGLRMAAQMPFVGQVCRGLEGLGVRCLPPPQGTDFSGLTDVSAPGSRFPVLCGDHNRLKIMAQFAAMAAPVPRR